MTATKASPSPGRGPFEQLDIPILLVKLPLDISSSPSWCSSASALLPGADAQGDRAVVSNPEMLEHMEHVSAASGYDHAKFEKQSLNAIEKMKNLSLLRKVQGADERYEVSPTLNYCSLLRIFRC